MEKGKSLELQIKEFLEWELKQGRLGISPDTAKIYHRKSYYSRERSSNIITDVSLELTRPGAEDPFFIWVWECKDYNHSVPVDDIEEFHSKLEQIGLHKTKGTVVCRNGFQRAAIKFAKSKAVSLARILADGTMHRLTEAVRTVSDESLEFGLTEQDTLELDSMFYAVASSGEGVTNFTDLFLLEIEEMLS